MTPTSLFKEYERVEQIGTGGMGQVFKALNPKTGSWVAIKLLHQHISCDKEASQRFEREGRTQARLRNANIVPAHDIRDFAEGKALIMPFVDGLPLHRLLEATKLPPAAALAIFLGILRGVAYLHKKNVVHRDLKPANIIIDSEDGLPKLLDFGISKPRDMGDLTVGPTQMGTPAWMAPEQTLHAQDATECCDVFSLGLLLYALLNGSHPFQRDTQQATALAAASEDPPPLWPGESGDQSPGLEEVFRRAIHRDSNLRYSSAGDFLQAFERLHLRTASSDEVASLVAEVSARTPVPSVAVVPDSWKQARTKKRLEPSWKLTAAAAVILTVAALAALFYVASTRGVPPGPAPPAIATPPAVATPQAAGAEPPTDDPTPTKAPEPPPEEPTLPPANAPQPRSDGIVGAGKKPPKAKGPTANEQLSPEDILLGRKPAAKER